MFTQRYESQLILSRPIEEVWSFFSKPANLAQLSPAAAGIQLVSPPAEQEMYPGQIVHLKMGPFPIFKLSWYSEITQIKPLNYFIDDQITGPFKTWHHQHHFRAIDSQTTEIRDLLHYQVPLGPIGLLANWLFVKRQVKIIFDYRKKALQEIFPAD